MAPPSSSCLKLNFDGSLIPPSNTAAGCVVHDSSSHPFMAFSKNLGSMDILQAEVVSLRDGLSQLALRTSQPLIIEGDSKILIDILNRRIS
ncbi:hypothetical protein ACLB2K_046186 [Fragaria x ananassa]